MAVIPDPATTNWVPIWNPVSTGPIGPPGPIGPTGPQGPSGSSSSVMKYRADTTSVSMSSDPGAGKMRWNNATQNLSTVLSFDRLTSEGFDVTLILQLNSTDDNFGIQDEDLAANNQVWKQTGPAVIIGGDWFNVPVQFVSGNTSFTNNQRLAILVKNKGATGPIGPAGPQGPAGPTGPQGPSGSVGAHHTTHELGGTDVITNNAWLSTPNIFTDDQTVSKAIPRLGLNDTSQGTDLKLWRIVSANAQLSFNAINDAVNAIISTPLALTRTGTVIIATTNPELQIQAVGNTIKSRMNILAGVQLNITNNMSLTGTTWNRDDVSLAGSLIYLNAGQIGFYGTLAGANPATLIQYATMFPTGAITVPGVLTAGGLGTTPLNPAQITAPIPDAKLTSNVALRNVDNQFVPQTLASGSIISGGNSLLAFNDTAAGVDLKRWRILSYSDGNLHLESLNDANNVVAGRISFYRTGSIIASASIYESSRAAAMGYWIDVPFVAGNFAGSGGGTWTVGAPAIIRNRYCLIGKTMLWNVYISWFSGSNVINGTVTGLYLYIPAGFTASGSAGAVNYSTDSTLANDVFASASGNVVVIQKKNSGLFTNGSAPGLITTFILELP